MRHCGSRTWFQLHDTTDSTTTNFHQCSLKSLNPTPYLLFQVCSYTCIKNLFIVFKFNSQPVACDTVELLMKVVRNGAMNSRYETISPKLTHHFENTARKLSGWLDANYDMFKIICNSRGNKWDGLTCSFFKDEKWEKVSSYENHPS